MSYEVIIPFLKPIQSLLESESISEIMVQPGCVCLDRRTGQDPTITRHSFRGWRTPDCP